MLNREVNFRMPCEGYSVPRWTEILHFQFASCCLIETIYDQTGNISVTIHFLQTFIRQYGFMKHFKQNHSSSLSLFKLDFQSIKWNKIFFMFTGNSNFKLVANCNWQEQTPALVKQSNVCFHFLDLATGKNLFSVDFKVVV